MGILRSKDDVLDVGAEIGKREQNGWKNSRPSHNRSLITDSPVVRSSSVT
jgi:hypothetical protein